MPPCAPCLLPAPTHPPTQPPNTRPLNIKYSVLAEATRERLAEAARRKEAEEREKAGQRHQRRVYKTGALSAEEKATRLAAMQADADEHDAQRAARLHDARRREEREEEGNAAAAAAGGEGGGDKNGKFLREATRATYGGEGASLADQVGRRKFYSDKTSGFAR